MLVNLPEKRYYGIGEIAKAFSVNTSLLRFWEKEFAEIQPKKKESGTRKYTAQDVANIQRIYHLIKEKGLTLEGTRKQLKLKNSESEGKLDLIEKLEKVKFELEELKNKL
jgi:DNA-binding transcriptional MerR regulator